MTLQQIRGDIGTARREWGEFVKDGKVVVARENAVAMIFGISVIKLHEMARNSQSLSIKPGPEGDEWTIIKLREADFGSSLMLSYVALYLTAAREINSGQRPDQVGEIQTKMMEVWDLLGDGIQTNLTQSAQSPDQLGKNLGTV